MENRKIKYGTLGIKAVRWTKAAKECHGRHCACSGCYYDDFFKDKPYKCKMKMVVLELVRTLGLPPKVITST